MKPGLCPTTASARCLLWPLTTYQEPSGLVVQSHVHLSHTIPHLGAENWSLHHTQEAGCSRSSLPPQVKQAPQ